MLQPAVIDMYADRWVVFHRRLVFVGYDMRNSAFAMQVRLVGDAPGLPLISIGQTTSSTADGIQLFYGGTDTIANHIAAGRLTSVPAGMTPNTSVALSVIDIRIATISTLPAAARTGDDMTLAWDLFVGLPAMDPDRFVAGKFIVRAGVTRA